MDVNKVKVLIQAVENGSLLATATKLGYTQAGLSHMMKSLESELGITLLQRGKFGIKLTDEGKRLMPLFKELAVIDKKSGDGSRADLRAKSLYHQSGGHCQRHQNMAARCHGILPTEVSGDIF